MKQIPINRILDCMEKKGMYPEYHHGISEMGWDDVPLITADWWQKKNGDLHTKLMDYILESYEGEIECEFDDEWTACSECGKAVRTSSTHYGWEPSYLWTCDCEIACHECCQDESIQDDIIEYYKNDTSRAVYSWFYEYLEGRGFICYSPDEYCKVFETGWRPGQNDNPQDVAKDIEQNLPGYDYMFKIDSVGQFDVHWSVFIRKSMV